MKFKNIDDMGHAWWYDHGNGQGSASHLWYEGRSIYSYGIHFEIARRLNSQTVLFNAEKYGSVSTGRHMNIVKDAIPYSVKVFNVTKFFNFDDKKEKLKEDHVENVRGFLYRANYILNKIKNPKRSPAKVLEIQTIRQEMIDYIDFFKPIPSWFDSEIRSEIKRLKKQNLVVTQEEIDALTAKKKKIQEEEEKKAKSDIAAWKRGATKNFGQLQKVFLRVKDRMIETSKGARMKMAEAKLLYSAIRNNSLKPGMKFNSYEIVSWNNNILTIGCTKIEKPEINYICKKLKWELI